MHVPDLSVTTDETDGSIPTEHLIMARDRERERESSQENKGMAQENGGERESEGQRNSSGEVESSDDANLAQRMPGLHDNVIRAYETHMERKRRQRRNKVREREGERDETFRRNDLSVDHTRETDGVVTNVNDFLNFTQSLMTQRERYDKRLE